MRTLRRIFFIVFFAVLCLIAGLSVSVPAFMLAAPSDFIVAWDGLGINYYNEKDGCVMKGRLRKNAEEDLISVSYLTVQLELGDQDNAVTVDEYGEIYLNGAVAPSSRKSEWTTRPVVHQETGQYYGYFETLPIKQWCAVIARVEYRAGSEVAYMYDNGSIFHNRRIDSSFPEAYFSGTWLYETDGVTFDITIRGNKRADVNTTTADSGIKSIRFIRSLIINGVETPPVDVYPESITNITGTFYIHKLKINMAQPAYYDVEVIDYAGNPSRIRIREVKINDRSDGFLDVISNAYEYIKANPNKFLPSLFTDIEKAYFEYLSAPTEELESARLKLNGIKQQAHDATVDAKNNKSRAFSISTMNNEYLTDKITANNFGETIIGALKFGEYALFNIAVAEYDSTRVDRVAELSLYGFNKSASILCLTLELKSTSRGTEVIESDFYGDLQLVVPVKNGYKTADAVLTYEEDGVTNRIKLQKTVSNGNLIIYLPKTYGQINIILDGKNANNNLYWLFMLLIIPVACSVFFIIYAVRKKRSKSSPNPK